RICICSNGFAFTRYRRTYMSKFHSCPALAKAFPATTRLTIEGERVREKMRFTERFWYPRGLGAWVRQFFPPPVEVVYIDRRKEEELGDDEDVDLEEAATIEMELLEAMQLREMALQIEEDEADAELDQEEP